MDRRERNSTQTDALLAAFEGFQAGVWTALPGIIQKFDSAKMTVEVQPTIQARWRDPFGNETWQTMPLCLDVPVVFPSGGGFTLTFPLAAGDECLIVFASRCIDAWWQSGGVGVQAEMRMHDLSDGFCLPGPFSQPRVISGISASATQLRSNDGTTFVEVADAAVKVQTTGDVEVVAPSIKLTGAVEITGPVAVTGAVVVSGTVTAADFISPGLPNYSTHRHTIPFVGVTQGPHV